MTYVKWKVMHLLNDASLGADVFLLINLALFWIFGWPVCALCVELGAGAWICALCSLLLVARMDDKDDQ